MNQSSKEIICDECKYPDDNLRDNIPGDNCPCKAGYEDEGNNEPKCQKISCHFSCEVFIFQFFLKTYYQINFVYLPIFLKI